MNEGFRAWGDPVNWRDPAVRIGHSPETFGGAAESGVHFVMADGSVKFASANTDPHVLKSLATPTDSLRLLDVRYAPTR